MSIDLDLEPLLEHMELYCNRKTVENATWADVEAVLPELRGEAFFRLSIMPLPERGPKVLEIQSEDGNYLPVLGCVGERDLRRFVNPDGIGKEMVSIGGDTYDSTFVTQDYDLIVRMIKEFYETGDVSPDLLR